MRSLIMYVNKRNICYIPKTLFRYYYIHNYYYIRFSLKACPNAAYGYNDRVFRFLFALFNKGEKHFIRK